MREIRQRIVRYLLRRKNATARDIAEYVTRATSVAFTEAQLETQCDTLHQLGVLTKSTGRPGEAKSTASLEIDRSLARIKPEGLAVLVDALPGTSWVSADGSMWLAWESAGVGAKTRVRLRQVAGDKVMEPAVIKSVLINELLSWPTLAKE